MCPLCVHVATSLRLFHRKATLCIAGPRLPVTWASGFSAQKSTQTEPQRGSYQLNMEKTNKQGYKAFQLNYDHLITAIDPSDVVDLCFQKGLVSQKLIQEIYAVRVAQGSFLACEKLLQALMCNGNQKVFQTFVEVLESKDHLKYLADLLRGKYVCMRGLGGCTCSAKPVIKTFVSLRCDLSFFLICKFLVKKLAQL